MPSKPITQQLDKDGVWYKMFKNAVCTSVDVVDKSVFPTTNMDNTAIYYCDRHANPDVDFCTKFNVNNNSYEIMNTYEKLFVDCMNRFYNSFDDGKKHNIKILIGWDRRSANKYVKKINSDKYYLNVNRAGNPPGGDQIWMSGTLKSMGVLNAEEEINDLKERTAEVNVIECPNKQYGENLKELIINGKVLRYGLWLTRVDRHIYPAQFKYVPNINYDKLVGETARDLDKSLLLACGFTNDDAEKVLDYLNDFDFTQSRNDMVREYDG